MDYREESAEIANRDSKLLEELSHSLSMYHFQVSACGRDGREEMERSRELARKAVKALVNYL